MAMPSLSVVPSFFLNDDVRVLNEDLHERTFDLNYSAVNPFVVIITVWPELHKTVMQCKDALGNLTSITLVYTDSDFNLCYDQLHANWYALKAMIETGIVKSLF